MSEDFRPDYVFNGKRYWLQESKEEAMFFWIFCLTFVGPVLLPAVAIVLAIEQGFNFWAYLLGMVALFSLFFGLRLLAPLHLLGDNRAIIVSIAPDTRLLFWMHKQAVRLMRWLQKEDRPHGQIDEVRLFILSVGIVFWPVAIPLVVAYYRLKWAWRVVIDRWMTDVPPAKAE